MFASALRWLIFLCLISSSVVARDYRFDGSMSEEVLRNYLSRSMTLMYLLTGQGDFDDNLRMMKECGVKFAGRAVYNWGREQGGEPALPEKLEKAKQNAARVHAVDPEIVLQACVFEIVSEEVNKLAIPPWVFEAFDQPVEARNFRYEAMIYPNGRGVGQWGKGASIPDVSQTETKLWFYYLAASYIEAGCEAIHFGQAEIMNGNDPDLARWEQVLTAVRAFAKTHARRHFVLCDAHVPHGGLVRDGRLLLDFHSFPLRIEEVVDRPQEGQLRIGFVDGIYGRSKGGITPSGWSCEHLPYLAEFDNYGRSKNPGSSGMGRYWIWGWDEITWFSQQPADYRNRWLSYAMRWIRENDPAGHLQMPGIRCLSGAANGKRWYYVNQPSERTPDGYGQEAAIRQLWIADSGAE